MYEKRDSEQHCVWHRTSAKERERKKRKQCRPHKSIVPQTWNTEIFAYILFGGVAEVTEWWTIERTCNRADEQSRIRNHFFRKIFFSFRFMVFYFFFFECSFHSHLLFQTQIFFSSLTINDKVAVKNCPQNPLDSIEFNSRIRYPIQ